MILNLTTIDTEDPTFRKEYYKIVHNKGERNKVIKI